MIRHFLSQDFRSHRAAWILIVIATLFMVPAAFSGVGDPFFTLMFPFMFGIYGVQAIVGTRVRSQQHMSRNYLLALPVQRDRMFEILQLRTAVFHIPMFVAIAIQLFVFGMRKGAWSQCAGIALICPPLLSGYMSSSLWTSVRTQFIFFGQLTGKQRLVEWIKLFAGIYLPIAVAVASIAAILFKPWTTLILLPILIALSIKAWREAKRQWLYQ